MIFLELSMPFKTGMRASKLRSPKLGLVVSGPTVSLSFDSGLVSSEGKNFIDLSNIVGAGGNMTVRQAGKPATRKGYPLFMQHLNSAYQSADDGTKQSLQPHVYLNGLGPIPE